MSAGAGTLGQQAGMEARPAAVGEPGAEVTPANPVLPRFELDERQARSFLCRALRRGMADPDGEGWTLRPGWDLDRIFSDEIAHVEDLVYYALQEGVITRTDPGTDIDLIIDAREGDWMYEWRVTFEAGTGFALGSPYREEFRRLGWDDDGTRARGCRTALAVLREAAGRANHLLDRYAAAGRAPVPGRAAT